MQICSWKNVKHENIQNAKLCKNARVLLWDILVSRYGLGFSFIVKLCMIVHIFCWFWKKKTITVIVKAVAESAKRASITNNLIYSPPLLVLSNKKLSEQLPFLTNRFSFHATHLGCSSSPWRDRSSIYPAHKEQSCSSHLCISQGFSPLIILFLSPSKNDIPCAWSDLSCNLNHRVRPSLVNRFSSFLRLRAETGQFPDAVSWLGWFSMMHCDDLEGEQRSLAHKSRPLRLLGVSARPVNLMIEKQALGQTARPRTVAL